MQPARRVLLYLRFLEATEGVDGARDRREERGGGLAAKSRRESRFRETIRNQRSGKWVPSLPEHAPGESRRPVRNSRKRPRRRRVTKFHEWWAGCEDFSHLVTAQSNFSNANEDRQIIIAVCVSILSYRDIVVSRALYPFKSKVALLAQIFTLNELIDGRTTSAPWMFGKRWEDDNIFILYICVYVHLNERLISHCDYHIVIIFWPSFSRGTVCVSLVSPIYRHYFREGRKLRYISGKCRTS